MGFVFSLCTAQDALESGTFEFLEAEDLFPSACTAKDAPESGTVEFLEVWGLFSLSAQPWSCLPLPVPALCSGTASALLQGNKGLFIQSLPGLALHRGFVVIFYHLFGFGGDWLGFLFFWGGRSWSFLVWLVGFFSFFGFVLFGDFLHFFLKIFGFYFLGLDFCVWSYFIFIFNFILLLS